MTEDTTVPSLVEYLAQIPDYRQRRGQRYGVLPMLLLVCVAMLCGARSQTAIADWAANYGSPWLERLGFTRGRGPSQPTLSRLFAQIAHVTVEAVLQQWAEQVLRLCPPPNVRMLEGVAVDGKTLRGSKRHGASEAHLLSAFSHRLGIVLGQLGVPDKTNEIGAADALLVSVVLTGRVVTADALLTQQSIAQTILDSGGDYLLVVKDNQAQLRADLEAAFALDADPVGLVGTARTTTLHGSRLERRELTATTALVGYSDWPGLQQALKLDRRVIHKATGQLLRQETAYAVTSCPPARATPAQLLTLWRDHWRIENQLHYVRDVTFDEDRSTVHRAHAHQVLAACRNTVLGLLRRRGATNIAATCRRYAAQPAAALAAVGLPPF